VPLALLLPRFCLLASVTVVEAKEKRNPYQAIRKNIPFILKHIGADIFGLLWAVGAIISLQFAIDSGVNHAWKSATVIILFTAGFGGCLCIFVLLHSKFPNLITAPTLTSDLVEGTRSTTLPIFSPKTLPTSQWAGVGIIALRGFAFHSFGYFIREYDSLAILYID
jgi:hypothetical protein